MDIDQAATFLVGSILMGAGCIVIASLILFLNNIFARYWKPVKWSVFSDMNNIANGARFIDPKEIDKTKEPSLKK
jgi:hypothetical protein